MDKITPKALREMSADIVNVLETIGVKHSVNITGGKMTYSDLTATMMLNIALQTEGNEGLDKYALDYKAYAKSYGLKPEWLHKVGRNESGVTFKVVGLKLTHRKYPVIVEREDGQKYKMTAKQVIDMFE